MYNLLSDTDKVLIKNYINAFAYNDDARVTPDSAASLEYILRFWSKNKAHLYEMFGNNFILERPITINRPEEDIMDEFECAFEECPMGCFLYDLRELKIDKDIQLKNCFCNGPFADLYGVLNLANSGYYMIHPYDYSYSINFPLPNGKKVTFEKGCNVVRMLGKIARAYGIDSFEEYRLKHSQILNNKTMSGTLCLSIHPLDYMTMSDNDCDWDTCMSWQENGCFRSGTVECMNSDCVIVAYLKSKHDMCIPNGTWNSKKWRSLFIVKDNLITSIKSSPYPHQEMNHIVLEWLRELSGRKYGPIVDYNYNGIVLTPVNKDKPMYGICFTTENHHMYNDFGCQEHSGIFNLSAEYDYSKSKHRWDYPVLNYAGPSVCVHCGAEDNMPCEEEYLLCEDCATALHCECCGERIHTKSYTLEDRIMCPDCYYENRMEDPINGKEYYEPHSLRFYLVPENLELPESIWTLRGNNPITRCIYIQIANSWYDDRDCLANCPQFKCKSLRCYQYGWNTYLYVRPSDLTEEGFKMFEEALADEGYESFDEYYQSI